MKSWWKDIVSWLMIGTALLVVLLSTFWIHTSYLEAKEELARETSYLFSHAVRTLEDSLIQNSFLNGLDIAGHQRVHAFEIRTDSVVSDSNIVRVIKGRISARSAQERTKRRRWHRRMMGSHDRGFAGTLGIHLQISDSSDLQSLGNKEINKEAVYTALKRVVDPAFANQHYPFNYQLISSQIDWDVSRDSIWPLTEPSFGSFDISTRAYHDMSADRRYFIALSDTTGYLIKQIRFQILFCLLLVGLTIATFYFSFRALSKERRLTQIRKDLVSNITHELKTPIATVKVALEAIQNFGIGSDLTKRSEYLQIAETELDRLTLLVDNVLKTSVQEGKAMQLQMQRIDLNELVQNILTTMQLQFDKLQAKIYFDPSQGPMWIDGDRTHLTSVIYNLLDNALKYSTDKPKITVTLNEHDKHYKLAISDSGLGMEKEELSKIFDKFYRIPQADVHDTKGYGLGLSYVAEVMKKHAGSIQVTSQKGAGSTFVIAMPQAAL